MLVEPMRKMMDVTLGALSPSRAQALARSLMNGEGTEQVAKVAQDLIDWSNRNRERLTELVRSEVRSQLKQLGVASRDEVEALRKRVRELEKTRTVTTKRPVSRPKPSSVKQPGTRAAATVTASA